MLDQPYVFRAYYTSMAEMNKSVDEFELMGLFGDTHHGLSNETSQFKFVFTEKSPNTVKMYIKRLTIKPKLTEIFDPSIDWTSGFKHFHD